VGVKLDLNVGKWIVKGGLEPSIAALTYADGRRRGFLYDPQLPLFHGDSLARLNPF
jgi:hypothetical protein